MKKLFGFLILAVVAGSVVWYESQPTTVTVPVETTDETSYYEPETTAPATSTTQVSQTNVDFDRPDVTLEVTGAGGDRVRLVEMIGKPQHLEELPAEVEAALRECPRVSDRDMAVRVDTQMELTSSLPAKVLINHGTVAAPALFKFSSGLSCSTGRASHDLEPGQSGRLTFWVVLEKVITPDNPDGDFQNDTWSLPGPVIGLPNPGEMHWKMWGPRVVGCPGFNGGNSRIWLEGITPADSKVDCYPADSETRMIGNF